MDSLLTDLVGLTTEAKEVSNTGGKLVLYVILHTVLASDALGVDLTDTSDHSVCLGFKVAYRAKLGLCVL